MDEENSGELGQASEIAWGIIGGVELVEEVNRKQEMKREDRIHLLEMLRSDRMSLSKYITAMV